MPLNLNNLEEVEAFKKLVVVPMVETLRAEIRPLVEAQTKQAATLSEQAARLETIEKSQFRITAVASVIAGAVGYLGSLFKH